MLYFCKGSNVVVAIHGDEQIYLDPIKTYGLGCYIIADYSGKLPPPPPPSDPNLPPPPQDSIPFPTITPAMQAISVKLECRRRIVLKVSDQAQRNMTTYITQIQSQAIMSIGATPPTPEEQSDIDTADAIWAWIGRPDGMQGACDAMIAANDLEWYQDVKWPPWNSAWDAFVARF